MTDAEIIELALLTLQLVDSQFQYWLSASFAVIVASHLVGHQLSAVIRWGVAFVYLIAVAVFFDRYWDVAGNAVLLIAEAKERGFPWGQTPFPLPGIIAPIRVPLMIFGSLITLWFVVRGFRTSRGATI